MSTGSRASDLCQRNKFACGQMRSIKHGWYATGDDGNLASGASSSFEECVRRISQPTNWTMTSNLQRAPSCTLVLPTSGVSCTFDRGCASNMASSQNKELASSKP